VLCQVERFRSVCESLAKAIVEDIHKPARLKRFSPSSTKGVAGGEKYHVGNVFLKLAMDVFGVYGGTLHAFLTVFDERCEIDWPSPVQATKKPRKALITSLSL
jgi:hypothetical protein